MGDDQQFDLQQILELQRRLHFREFILEHPFDASLELSLNNRKGEAIFPKVFYALRLPVQELFFFRFFRHSCDYQVKETTYFFDNKIGPQTKLIK